MRYRHTTDLLGVIETAIPRRQRPVELGVELPELPRGQVLQIAA